VGLQAPPFDAPPQLFADWLELKASIADQKKIWLVDVERAWEATRESENTDFEGQDQEFEEWLRPVLSCIERRARILGNAYPFLLDDEGDRLTYVGVLDQTHVGHTVYLLCLILSSVPESEILERTHEKIPHATRDRFQACAAWAAAAVIGGSAYVFGWPRPDGSDFLTALSNVYQDQMGDRECIVRDAAPPGSSGAEKDGGIDVVAWRPRLDSAAGKVYLLGQVATGKNWPDKSILGDIPWLHDNWFSYKPASTAIPAMFIPYSIVPEGNASVEEQLRMMTPRFGIIIYRDVFARYAQEGFEAGMANHAQVHRLSDHDAMSKYVERFLKLLA
jgi:hypothetical protein